MRSARPISCPRSKPVGAPISSRRACVLRDLAVEQGQIFRQPVKLADVPIDRRALIVRQRLGGQPRPAAAVEKIGMRALRDQVRVQDRMHLVLEPRAADSNGRRNTSYFHS
ncbi:hypothetical protein IVB35_14905 [Bradyrhizobium sp. 30]|nr:hypothetical protein [Bradyrhizobium sp. 30]